MSRKYETWESLEVPASFSGTHRLGVPKNLAVYGEVNEAEEILNVANTLTSLTRFMDNSIRCADTGLIVLTLEHGKGKDRIIKNQPAKLANGYGLEEGYTTDALFVGPRRRKIRPESAIWLGRALATSSVETVYYLNNGIDHIGGLEEAPKFTRIDDFMDVIKIEPIANGTSIPYTQAHEPLSVRGDMNE